MPIRVPVVQTGLEASIQVAAKKAGKAMKIDMGAGAKSIEGLSQPLGRISGKADQFTKSMEAANARVLAFGASVGVLSAVTRGFQELVKTTIEVEKRLTSINSILGGTTAQLNNFKKEIFDVARNTEQSFDTVSQAALELSRQGLKAEEVTSRLNDALILSRLSGLGASEAVFGLTAAINSFRKEGISSAEVLNKLSAAAVSAAVSEKDLIEGIKRSGSVATQAGVSFNELVGVITAVQERTARGGAVIGNSFKTIFTRIQSLDKLKTMQQLGVEITDAGGQVLGATKLIQNLAKTLETLPDAKRLQIAENLVGKFQIAPFLAILEDYNSATSTAIRVTEVSANATREAYERNVALSKTLSHAINETVLNVKELAETLGKIGVTENLRGVLDFFSNLTANITKVLEGDTLGSKFAKGIVKGIGGILSGPGLAIFGAIIAKLTLDLARFGIGSLRTFFGLNKAARDQVTLQGQIASTLLGNKGIQAQIMAIENSTLSIEQKRAAQTRFFTIALNEQLAVMTRMQAIAARVAPGVMAGTRGVRGRGAGGYIPNFNATMGYGSEQADINRGVGGAPKGARPVTMPNFNFGGGQRGTMVANSSEYVVPHFGGKSGSAIFNQNMVAEMGLPAGARKIGAAGGYIPNFAAKKKKKAGMIDASPYFMLVPQMKDAPQPLGEKTIDKQKVGGGLAYGFQKGKVKNVKVGRENEFTRRMRASIFRHTARFTHQYKPLGRSASSAEIRKGFDSENAGAKGALQGVMGSAFEVGIMKSLDYQAAIREKGGDFDVRLGTNIEKIRELFKLPASKHTGDFKVSTSPGNVKSFYKKIIKEHRAGDIDLRKEKNPMALKLATQLVRRDPRFSAMFGTRGQPLYKDRDTVNAEVQRRLPEARASFTRGASGYIPNYASPLEDAISRERAAGLPISQIRINQDGSLRNPANPQGLAVTNMRDEPTGAIPRGAGGYIPNYYGLLPPRGAGSVPGLGPRPAVPPPLPAGGTPLPAGGANPRARPDMLGPIFAVQMAMSAMSGATSDATSAMGKYTNITVSAMSGMTTAVFAGTALTGFGKDIQASGGSFKTAMGGAVKGLGLLGMAVGAGVAVYKGIIEVINEQSGANKRATMAVATLADAAKHLSVQFGSLSQSTQAKLGIEAGEVVSEDTVKSKVHLLEKKLVPNALGSGWDIKLKNLLGVLPSLLPTEPLQKTLPFGMKDTMQQEEKRFFGRGKAGDKLEAVFTDTAKHFMALGTTAEDIDKILDGFGRDLTGDKLKKFVQHLEKKSREVAPELGRFTNLLQKGFADDPRGLEQLKNLETLLLQEGSGISPTGRGGKEQALDTLRTRVGGDLGDAGMKLAEFIKIELVQKEIKKRELADDKRSAEGKRVVLDIAKEEFKVAIQRNKQQRGSTLELEKRLATYRVLATIDKSVLRGIETSKLELELTNKVLAARLDLLGKSVADLKEIDLSERELKAIIEDINELSDEELANGKGMIEVLKKSTKLRELGDKALNNIVKLYVKGNTTIVEGIEYENNRQLAIRRSQDAANDLTESLNQAKEAAKEAAAAMKFETVFKVDTERIRLESEKQGLQQQFGGGRQEQEARARRIQQIDADLSRHGRRKAEADLLERAQNMGVVMGRGVSPRRPAVGVGVSGAMLRAGMQAMDIRDREEELAQAKTIQEKIDVQIKNLDDLGDIQKDVKTKRRAEINALQRDYDALIQSADATEASADLRLKLGAETEKTIEALKRQSRDMTEVGLPSRGRAALRRARAIDPTTPEGAPLQDLSIADAQLVSDMQRGVLDRALERPDFDSLAQADTLASTLEQAAINFKNTMSDAMVDSIIQGGNLGDILRSAATDYFTMISKAYMKSTVDQLVGSALPNPTGGGGGGGGGSGVGNFLGAGLRWLGGALGGGQATGGPVTGGSGIRDDVPTMLMGGEYVVRKSAVKRYGPEFLEALNREGIQTMAAGGVVGQGGRGNFITPGVMGRDAIVGKRNLLDFATQSHTVGMQDQIFGGEGFGSVALEPQSMRLTHFGMQGKRSLAEQESKKVSLGLYFQQLQVEEAIKKANEERKKAFWNSMAAAAISVGINQFATGFSESMIASKGTGQGMFSRLSSATGSGFTGFEFGGDRHGGLFNFTGSGGNPLPSQIPSRNPNQTQILRAGYVGHAGGGYVSPTAGIDTVPSMLSGGEFVMNAAATESIGRDNLTSLNSGGGNGGNDAIVARLDELIDVTDGSGESVINITINSDGTETQDDQGADEQQQNLAERIRDVVRATIEEEQRLGGSLTQARA